MRRRRQIGAGRQTDLTAPSQRAAQSDAEAPCARRFSRAFAPSAALLAPAAAASLAAVGAALAAAAAGAPAHRPAGAPLRQPQVRPRQPARGPVARTTGRPGYSSAPACPSRSPPSSRRGGASATRRARKAGCCTRLLSGRRTALVAPWAKAARPGCRSTNAPTTGRACRAAAARRHRDVASTCDGAGLVPQPSRRRLRRLYRAGASSGASIPNEKVE